MITGTWVLILWFGQNFSGKAIDHVDGFSSYAECQQAITVIQKKEAAIRAACVVKGAKQ